MEAILASVILASQMEDFYMNENVFLVTVLIILLCVFHIFISFFCVYIVFIMFYF